MLHASIAHVRSPLASRRLLPLPVARIGVPETQVNRAHLSDKKRRRGPKGLRLRNRKYGAIVACLRRHSFFPSLKDDVELQIAGPTVLELHRTELHLAEDQQRVSGELDRVPDTRLPRYRGLERAVPVRVPAHDTLGTATRLVQPIVQRPKVQPYGAEPDLRGQTIELTAHHAAAGRGALGARAANLEPDSPTLVSPGPGLAAVRELDSDHLKHAAFTFPIARRTRGRQGGQRERQQLRCFGGRDGKCLVRVRAA